MARTDPYTVVVMHEDGSRFSDVGSKKECEKSAASQQRKWGKGKTTVLIQKRN